VKKLAEYTGSDVLNIGEIDIGAKLYYLFDTHWKPRGHDLAVETIASYLGDMLPVTEGKQPCK